ncbi:hypothetical protein GDO78_013877 [Eleutherodactylus coqui]|uniref:Immunoglobulin V-set domain-containing protein n=1 Tax=Eleutherodactylus coqui TaxID=57060 RepID=A0A8J6E7A2_ELECQ|nr:hypothetical protein GDO78_013877 [Eleutherodactylus coqui]
MFFILEGVAAQISLVVSVPGTVKPTETLEMTCKVSGASLTDSTNMHCVHWVRQSDGKGLEWLGAICYNNNIYYGQSLKGRLTLTRDTNKGEVYLKLTGVKPEESGTYYAAREGHSVTDGLRICTETDLLNVISACWETYLPYYLLFSDPCSITK